jgi:hypothetical protein
MRRKTSLQSPSTREPNGGNDGPLFRRLLEHSIARIKSALEENNFTVFLVSDTDEARKTFLESILPDSGASTVSWGGSVTAAKTGIYDLLKARAGLQVIDAFERGISPVESLDRRRRAFFADLYLTGANALTEAGQLVNLDRTGNRVAALAFGPKNVVVLSVAIRSRPISMRHFHASNVLRRRSMRCECRPKPLAPKPEHARNAAGRSVCAIHGASPKNLSRKGA